MSLLVCDEDDNLCDDVFDGNDDDRDDGCSVIHIKAIVYLWIFLSNYNDE